MARQHLAGALPAKATGEDIISTIRDIAYVQWDPVSIVAPSHVLSLWSRVGNFRLSDLDRLLWNEKKLFEHWTPMASLVLTQDYPLYLSLMKRYPTSLTGSWRSHEVKARKFLSTHGELRSKMLRELAKGPLQLSQFEDHIRTRREAEAFNPESDVSEMLYHLHMSGEVMVVGHQRNQNVWGLAKEFLPEWVDRGELTEREFENLAAQRAIRALGTATPSEVNYYFVRGRYRNLKRTLAGLHEESTIHRVIVEGLGKRDERYIHSQDLGLLESVNSGDWQPRMSLLPPFDNLICSTARTSKLFGFDYVREQFLPREKRRFGTYVLPILWGDRLIGRIDPQMDRQKKRLKINSVHAEPDVPSDRETPSRIRDTIDRLADFLGAKEVEYTSRVPTAWRSVLR